MDAKIAIVGAGVSGLSAAYTLKKAGIQADIYEASSVAGGRCRNDYEDGWQFYVGAGSTEPQWETTFAYLNELGIADKVTTQAGEARIGFVTKGKIHAIKFGGPISTLGSLIKFLPAFPFKVYTQGIRFLKILGKYQKELNFKEGDFTALEEMSNLSIYDWCQQNGYQEFCTYVLDPLVANMVCGNSKLISMGHIIVLFSLMQGLCTLDGGMGIISENLEAQVHDEIRYQTPVDEVVIENGKVTGVKVAGKLINYDHVIVALDAKRTLSLVPGLSQAQQAALSTCDYSSVFYYQFGLEHPVESLRHGSAFFAANESNLLAGVSQSDAENQKPIILSQTKIEHFDMLAAMSEEERLETIIRETRKVLPEFPEHPDCVHGYRWDISVNLEGPGQFKAIEELKAHHLDDISGLHLAGDYMFLIASTEGSMDAGRRRAEDIIRELGKPIPPLHRQ